MMTEEQKPEEKPDEKPEEPVAPEAAGISPDINTSRNMIDDANLAAKRLEEANKEAAKIVSRQEALKVEETLGGKSDASVKNEVSDEEYAKKVMAGERP